MRKHDSVWQVKVKSISKIMTNSLLLVRNVTIDGGGGVGVLETHKRPDWPRRLEREKKYRSINRRSTATDSVFDHTHTHRPANIPEPE